MTETDNVQEYANEIKTTVGCKSCGKDNPPTELHFHHIDGETKVDSVSSMISRGCSLEKVKNEIRKCEVLCAECHCVHHHQVHTEQDCIDAIQEVAEELDRSPTRSEYREHRKDSHPSINPIQRKFASWNSAKEAAGLSTVAHGEGIDVYTKQDCIDAIRYVAEKLDNSPSQPEYREHRKDSHPSLSTVIREFGSWNDAKRFANLTEFKRGGRNGRHAVESEQQTSFTQFSE